MPYFPQKLLIQKNEIDEIMSDEELEKYSKKYRYGLLGLCAVLLCDVLILMVVFFTFLKLVSLTIELIKI